MPLYQVVILALVQALTEFLPISSTAHLFLVPWLLGWGDPGLTFTVAVHAGTLAGVLAFFLQTWVKLGLAALGVGHPRGAPEEETRRHRTLFWHMVAGTVPAAIVGYFFERQIETTLRDARLMAVMLIAFGLLLGWADRRIRSGRSLETVTLADALVVGAAQAVSLVPGVSRSGITITVGLFRGMSREAAARFTFLLSTPIIAAAAVRRFLELRRMPVDDGTMVALALGAVAAAIASYLVIAFFLRYLQTRTLRIFVYYRVAFGIVVLLLVFLQRSAR